MAAKKAKNLKPYEIARQEGVAHALSHPLFRAMGVYTQSASSDSLADHGLAAVTTQGHLHLHPTRHATKEEWTWSVAHVLTHLGMGHDDQTVPEKIASCAEVNRLLANLKVGTPPEWVAGTPEGNRDTIVKRVEREGVVLLGANERGDDVHPAPAPRWSRQKTDWEARFEIGLRNAVSAALAVASGEIDDIRSHRGVKTAYDLALKWFITEYPLLGGLAMDLELVADEDVCLREHISIAAVSASEGVLYVNPKRALTIDEWKFVMAHEMLHVGLRHDIRAGGRDHELWNVACDYAVNSWLIEMGVGSVPQGLLYDPELKGLSAESIYDRIVRDERHYRKLMTLRGVGIGDILTHRHRSADEPDLVDLDSYYRRALQQGLDLHVQQGRGMLPAGLVEEIRALDSPPVPWDVELAEWFEERFPALEPVRTYARPSRRQGSTPDIPRPAHYLPEVDGVTRTFGVVLDTSGSMDRRLLGQALGAIASYATSRDVRWVRLVFCDAVAYDEGYVDVESIAERVRVRGRGGTILQPGVNLIENADDFPEDGPILVITDTGCESNLKVKRDHAYLIPANTALPFQPIGPVFKVS